METGGRAPASAGTTRVGQMLAGQAYCVFFNLGDRRFSSTYSGGHQTTRLSSTPGVRRHWKLPTLYLSRILWSFDSADNPSSDQQLQTPEHLPRRMYLEGAARQVLVNAYERDRTARQACIVHHGTACCVRPSSMHRPSRDRMLRLRPAIRRSLRRVGCRLYPRSSSHPAVRPWPRLRGQSRQRSAAGMPQLPRDVASPSSAAVYRRATRHAPVTARPAALLRLCRLNYALSYKM